MDGLLDIFWLFFWLDSVSEAAQEQPSGFAYCTGASLIRGVIVATVTVRGGRSR